MKRKNKKKLQELLQKVAEIAQEEDTLLSVYVSQNGQVMANNNHWDLPKKKQIDMTSFDRGQTWTDL